MCMIIQESVPRPILLSNFQKKLDVSFNSIDLLDSALTHRSFLNEGSARAVSSHNERLEFLGDAVLGQAVALLLYSKLEGRPEGELARIKSIAVSEQTLAPIAAQIGIAEALRMGRGEELSGGRKKKALLADALEAVIGALFLDQGWDAAHRLVASLLEPAIAEALAGQSKDYKTIIQEYAQKYLKALPVYNLARIEGPDHERLFWVACRMGSISYGPFPGKTKKEAEQAAAEDIYKQLGSSDPLTARRLEAIASLSP